MSKWVDERRLIEEVEEPRSAGSCVRVEHPEWGSVEVLRIKNASNEYFRTDKPWISTQDGERFAWSDFSGEVYVIRVGDVPVELMNQRRLSRPCYDKYYRCPGRNGGGLKYPTVHRCDTGRLRDMYGKRLWKWRFNGCTECAVIVWPYMIRCVDPTNWGWREIKWWANGVWTWKLRYPYLRVRRWVTRRVLRTQDR